MSWILKYKINVFSTWKICICEYHPTLTVTDCHTDDVSIYISCAKKKYLSKILMFSHINYVSDDIYGSLNEIIWYVHIYD